MALPMSGPTWVQMVSVANSNLGVANMSDQDSPHGEKVLALALVAVRTSSEALKLKAAAELTKAIGTENNPDPDCASPTLGARGLAVGRNLVSYVVAADILNLRSGGYDPNGMGTTFQAWVDHMRSRKNCDSNGKAEQTHTVCDGIYGTTSNGNLMSFASCGAASAYLGDKAKVDEVWLQFQRYAGNRSVGTKFTPNSYSANWKSSDTTADNYVGINPPGAHCLNASAAYPADGVVPNDQGRGGDCPTDPNVAPSYTAYPWEGLQGAYATAVILDHLGYRDAQGHRTWELGSYALLRAVKYQQYLQDKFGGAWYDTGRAAWVKHLACKAYSYNCNTATQTHYKPYGGGRNMDWTQWTHQ